MLGDAITMLACGLALFGLIFASRFERGYQWRRSLVALRLRFPRGLTDTEVSAWLAAVGTSRKPVALEVVGSSGGIAHYLIVREADRADLLALSRSVLPRLSLDDAPDYLADRSPDHWSAAAELRLTNISVPLATDRGVTAATALLAALSSTRATEVVRVQYIVTGLPTPRPRPATDPARDRRQTERVKHREPLVGMTLRVGVVAPTAGRAHAVLHLVVGTLRLLDAPGVSVARRVLPARMVAARLSSRAWPLSVWPLVLNTKETAGLLALPYGRVNVPGLALGRARQLAPPANMATSGGAVIADSNYAGLTSRPLVISALDRLSHVYQVGPTGVGKSTLIANMVLADAASGHGLVLIDPKGDLVETVLERLPEDVAERVIVLDPSAMDRPIGFNPLAAPRADEAARELVADQVLHVFRDLYRSSWGPRTDDVLRAALLTLVSVPAPDGSAFTVAEVPELLISPVLRHYVMTHPALAESLRGYWRSFESLSEGERLQQIGPVNNKLRAFTMRTPVRLMLGQSHGLDLSTVIRQRYILLVNLAKGKIGTETSHLVGSLLVAAFWQAALGRVSTPADRRYPFFLYLDEFQDVVRLSEGLADLLSQARGLGVGAVLANQYLAQLPESIRQAVLGTVRTQVVFQVEYDDARLLERRFAPALSADDLMGLDAHDVAIRPSIGGQTTTPVTGTTRPLSEPLRAADFLATASRDRFGTDRAEVEHALMSRIDVPSPNRIGRRMRLGQDDQ
jgi:hypothetical protein